MFPSNTSSNVRKPSYAKFLSPKMNNFCKRSSDRHLKVDGKDRRICLPKACAGLLFELQKKLEHRTAGQTVEWLLIQAKSSVNDVLNKNPTSSLPVPNVPYPHLSSPMSDALDPMIFPSHAEFHSIPILAGDKMSSTISTNRPILPPSKYGSEIDVEIAADAVAKFLSE